MPIVKSPLALLTRLLQEPGESPWLEFKHNNKDPDVIGRSISACANAAVMSGKDRAYVVFGIENITKRKIGTDVVLNHMKKGGVNLPNWISTVVDPKIMISYEDFEDDGKKFSIVVIEPSYDRPVKFNGNAWFRVGENTKKLADYPEHERALWMATGRRRFENGIALPHQSVEQILEKLDVKTFYSLAKKEDMPKNIDEIMRKFCQCELLIDDMEGGYDITNLGAILLAKDIGEFPSIATKSVRIIQYVGNDKTKSSDEIEGKKGYAVGFSGLMNYLIKALPSEEKYFEGVRTIVSVYPETAIREVIANALIHQDFSFTGAGPTVEIYSDRIEVTNPGNSLIPIDRLLDDRRSRNEKLASTMRSLHLCEERGGGLDKTMIAIELEKNLPAPDINSSENSMRVVLFGRRSFNNLSKEDKQRACFWHCVIRWIKTDFMSNATLRERFSLPPEEYQAVSGIISEAIKRERIVAADENQGNRNARYVPYWAKNKTIR